MHVPAGEIYSCVTLNDVYLAYVIVHMVFMLEGASLNKVLYLSKQELYDLSPRISFCSTN